MDYKKPILFGDDEFRYEFSEKLSDTYNLILWAIIGDHLKIDGDAELELKRVKKLYVEIIIEAECEHQKTGKKFDDCLDDLFWEACGNSSEPAFVAEISLSAAWNSVLKAYFHCDNRQMDLGLSELLKSNFYFGLFVSRRDILMLSKECARKAADKRWENNGTKELHIKIVNCYRENYDDGSMSKEAAAWEISQLEWCELSADRVIKFLTPDYIYKIMKVQGLLL
ncbi:hypothetical protein ACH5Y9_11765 [Methylomonas sp. BW4-1]|uniref:hypothetical protein n=1 Tax=Methylomonas sp. BW4-1 TaxID=3376685 RepID=UPI00404273F2